MKKIRRQDRAITKAAATALLEKGEYGILSTVGPDGQPYGVPLNYVFIKDAIYFHSAREGHKLENMMHKPEVSFCVVGKTEVLPADFSTQYESTIVFGRASFVDGAEKKAALLGLIEKYAPDFKTKGVTYVAKKSATTTVVKIVIAHIRGKARPKEKPSTL